MTFIINNLFKRLKVMIKLSFLEPVYQETETKKGLKAVTCIIMYRPKGIDTLGGPGFMEAIGIDSKYRKAVGTAICDPHDKYDSELGKKLARSRAKDAAYTGFYNAIRECQEKCDNILGNLGKNMFAKAAMVKTRNNNYRKKVCKTTTAAVKPASEAVEVVVKTPKRTPRRATVATQPEAPKKRTVGRRPKATATEK